MAKIILKGHILVPENDLALVKTELSNHINLTKQEVGCLVFDVTQDKDNLHKFSVYEEFIDQAAFDKHQARVKNSRWGQITTDVERHYQIMHMSS